MRLHLDLDKVRANVRQAETEDLLDRATFYRAGMEPEAIEIIEEELRRRGVTAADQLSWQESGQDCLRDADGTAVKCSYCRRPAVYRGWGWHRLWGLIPVFPRKFALCKDHAAACGAASR